MVLGVDLGWPGGYAVVDNRERLCCLGPIRRSLSHGEVLHLFRDLLMERFDGEGHWMVTDVASEQVGTWGWRTIGASQRAMAALLQAAVDVRRESRGDALPLLSPKVVPINPQTMRKAICGSGRASKAQVQRTVQRIFGWLDWAQGEGEAAREHMLDAAAIAVTAVRRLKVRVAA
jgi:hypothetical protein